MATDEPEVSRKGSNTLRCSTPPPSSSDSIHGVYMALIEAGILVLIVIMLFLQNFRAMLVPATTVPVTIIGAFAAMALLGFTVNLMTLFALILAIGIVVDDAIVIVENASHYIEQGLTPKDAAIKAMSELTGPVLGITLVLDLGFPAGFFSAGNHRADVPPVRAGHRRDRDHQRAQRADAEAHAMRAVPRADGPRTTRSTGSIAASTRSMRPSRMRYIGLVSWMAHRPWQMACVFFVIVGTGGLALLRFIRPLFCPPRIRATASSWRGSRRRVAAAGARGAATSTRS